MAHAVTTGTSTQLVPVFTGQLSDAPAQLCNARDLHAFMGVKRDFTTWIKGRIRKFGFIEGVDYLLAKSEGQVFTQFGENLGGRPSTDYHLTLDMAKELAMVENNEQGRAARRYFIACEKQLATQGQTQAAALTNAQKQHLRELVDIIAATGKQTYAETWARLHRKFHVPSYHALPPSEFERAVGYLHGKLDTESIGALVQKHCAPLLPAPMARMDVTPEQLIKKWAELGNYPFDVGFMHHIVQVFTERIFSAYQFQRSRANGSVNRW